MNSLLSKIVSLTRLHIVGAVRTEAGESYNVLTIGRKGNEMSVIDAVSFDSIEELAKNIDSRLLVIAVIDGKGILSKRIDFDSETDQSWYKSIDFSTIYHTSLQNGTVAFMSFCRRNIADALLESLTQSGFQVADVYVGNFLSALLQPAIASSEIQSGNLSLEFDPSGLSGFTRNEHRNMSYSIGRDTVISPFLPLYGTALHFFAPQRTVSKTTIEKVSSDEILYRKVFNIAGISILGGFLIALLTSFLLIQHYGSKNASLNMQNVYAGESYKRILELEKQKLQKQQILSDTGLLSPKFLSFFAYEILKSVPGNIVLAQINITPAEKERKPNKKINFDARSVIIGGQTVDDGAFNGWLGLLKKMNWIKELEILKLTKDKKHQSQFEIKITVKDV